MVSSVKLGNYKGASEIFVGMNFEVVGNELVFKSGFAKKKFGISKSVEEKVKENKTFKTNVGETIEI